MLIGPLSILSFFIPRKYEAFVAVMGSKGTIYSMLCKSRSTKAWERITNEMRTIDHSIIRAPWCIVYESILIFHEHIHFILSTRAECGINDDSIIHQGWSEG
ncbi:hypothetical protein HanPSC8_Chr14g0641661 [Helianthus annuus]|nr:hypothetical protein HanPSC8_Chr14g0641661 [Helianthus annuus]